jgi:hypothetical protein
MRKRGEECFIIRHSLFAIRHWSQIGGNYAYCVYQPNHG